MSVGWIKERMIIFRMHCFEPKSHLKKKKKHLLKPDYWYRDSQMAVWSESTFWTSWISIVY